MTRPALLCASLCVYAVVVAGDEPLTPKPGVFTMARADATLGEVLDEFHKQTGLQFTRDRAEVDRKLSVSFEKEPIWSALERIARDADHQITFGGEGRKVVLMGGNGVTYKESPLSIDGLFRCSAKRVTATRDLGQDRSTCEVVFEVHWDPKFQALLVSAPGDGITVKDNTGADLSVADAGTGRRPVSGGGMSLEVRLADVPRAAKAIKLMEGQFKVIGTPRMMEIPFDDLKKDKQESQEKKENGVAVKLRMKFEEGEDRMWTASVGLTYPEEGPEVESFEAAAWLAENRVYLQSKDGKRQIPCNGGEETGAQSSRSASLVYRFVEQADLKLRKPSDWKLVVVTPAPLIEVPVKFKFENVPLP